jgi:hypothetical protein
MPAEHIDISAVVHSPEQEFTDWCESQDFDYQRTASAVIDYANQHIDYTEFDAAIADKADIGELNRACEKLGFHPDSTEADVVREHFESYISAQQ